MIFGEDGVRLQQKRDEQRRQYVEELKRQIAEKEKIKYPENTSNNFKPIQPPSNLPPQNQIAPRPSIVQPNNNNLPLKNNSKSPRISEPLPDLQPNSSPDSIRFADRLSWLENSVDQQQNVLKIATDSATRIEKIAIPSINEAIQQLKTSLDRVISVDLPGRLTPLNEENNRLEERINSSSNEFINLLSNLRDNLNENSTVFNQTTKKFNDFNDNIKNKLQEFKGDISRTRDSLDSVSQRIVQSESKSNQIEESLRSVTLNLTSFEKSSNDNILNSQNQINNAISTSSLQIAQDIKQENESRNQSTNLIHAQIEEVNQRLGSSVNNVQTVINDLNLSFKQSLNVLSNSVREALEDTRNSTEQKYQELSEKIDLLISDTEKNFNTIQNESIITLNSLNDYSLKSREQLEIGLTQEIETRRKNEKQIASKYESFMTLIVNEMQLQSAQMEELSNSTISTMIQNCNDSIIPLKTEANTIREKTRSLDSVIILANRTEQLISQLNSQLLDNVAAIGKQSSLIVSSIQKLRNDLDEIVDNYSERLKIIEDEENKPQFITREEVNENFNNFGNNLELRIQDIEQQIGIIFSNLSDLTMTLPIPLNKKEPGSNLLLENL